MILKFKQAVHRTPRQYLTLGLNSSLRPCTEASRRPAVYSNTRQTATIASRAARTMPESQVPHDDLVQALRRIVPNLNTGSHKGQSGKIGVMGGCREYTGAPYFAAMSALRMGCDLAYVFCTHDASPVIKSYSPELIVLPSLVNTELLEQRKHQKIDDDQGRISKRHFHDDMGKWLHKLSVLVIGPGLGDDPLVGECMKIVLRMAHELQLPVLVDGSGLGFVAQDPELVKGYKQCLLTPNIAEFGRLAKAVAVNLSGSIGAQWQEQTQELAAALGGPVVLSKGPQDVLSDGQKVLVVSQEGSPRRSGGQGDVLAGTTAGFMSWAMAAQKKQQQQQEKEGKQQQQQDVSPLLVAGYGGCLIVRATSALTYENMGRSMVAGDLLMHLGDKVLGKTGLLPQAQTKL